MNLTVKELAQKFGISEPNIYSAIKKAGLEASEKKQINQRTSVALYDSEAVYDAIMGFYNTRLAKLEEDKADVLKKIESLKAIVS